MSIETRPMCAWRKFLFSAIPLRGNELAYCARLGRMLAGMTVRQRNAGSTAATASSMRNRRLLESADPFAKGVLRRVAVDLERDLCTQQLLLELAGLGDRAQRIRRSRFCPRAKVCVAYDLIRSSNARICLRASRRSCRASLVRRP
jgi:hypothetical protein